MRDFQQNIARDTAFNEYVNHRQIYQWLSEAKQPVDLATFNKRVYAKLFLAPLDDPWMGLAPANAYSALQNGGLVDRNAPRGHSRKCPASALRDGFTRRSRLSTIAELPCNS